MALYCFQTEFKLVMQLGQVRPQSYSRFLSIKGSFSSPLLVYYLDNIFEFNSKACLYLNLPSGPPGTKKEPLYHTGKVFVTILIPPE